MASRYMPLLCLCLACLGVPGATAAEFPKVLFGELPQGSESEQSFEVSGNLVQIQLTRNLVISAGKGALINLFSDADDSFVLTVNRGPILALELDTGRVIQLEPGSYRLGTQTVSSAEDIGAAADYKLGFFHADAVMARQQAYLEKLRIDVRDINRGMVSIIRSLFPGSR